MRSNCSCWTYHPIGSAQTEKGPLVWLYPLAIASAFVHRLHHTDACGGFTRCDQRLVFLSGDGIHKLVQRSPRPRGKLRERLLSIGARYFLVRVIKFAVDDCGVCLCPAD